MMVLRRIEHKFNCPAVETFIKATYYGGQADGFPADMIACFPASP
jgi:hypothetical protein